MGLANAKANSLAVEALELDRSSSVIELGCGPGFALQSLLRSPAVARAIGVDWSDAMLADAARRNRHAIASGRLTLVRGDFARLPFADRIANAVLAVNVAYFMQGADAIREARRVLCSSGRLVLYATEASAMRHWPFADPHTHALFDRHELAALIAGGGFADASVRIAEIDAGFGVPGLIAVANR